MYSVGCIRLLGKFAIQTFLSWTCLSWQSMNTEVVKKHTMIQKTAVMYTIIRTVERVVFPSGKIFLSFQNKDLETYISFLKICILIFE